MEQKYFSTRAAQLVERALDRCAREQILSVMIANPGCGKSYPSRQWSLKHPEVPHVRIVCTVRNGSLTLIQAIATGLKLPNPRGMGVQLCEQIVDRMVIEPVMLILDEADMLRVDAMDRLRGIWDLVSEARRTDGDHAFPLALFGTQRLRSTLMRDDLERLHRRVGEFHELPPLNTKELELICTRKWPEYSFDDSGLGELFRLSRGSFGWLNRLVSLSAELAAKDGKVISQRIVKGASRYLVGVPEE